MLCFIDLQKPFDRVPKEKVWQILMKCRVTAGLYNVLRSFYNKTNNVVRTLNV